MKQIILRFLIGASASGKSTYAKEIKSNSVKESNRDALRAKYQREVQKLNIPETQDRPQWDKWRWKNESIITEWQDDEVLEFLKDNRTEIIIQSDTNLNYDRMMSKMYFYKALAEKLGIEIVPEFKVFYVDRDVLVKRDNARANGVGSDVIDKQLQDFYKLLPKISDTDTPEELKDLRNYLLSDKNPDLQDVILVDLDGTIASMNDRGPFEWDKVYNDSVISEHERIIESYLKDNYIKKVIFLTGRDAEAYNDSLRWLNRKTSLTMFDFELYSRAHKDTRKDYIIKRELFLEHIAGKYNVRAVFDDRPQVCRMWWNLGLKVYQMQNPYLEF